VAHIGLHHTNNENSDDENFPDNFCGTQHNSQDNTQDSEGDSWYSPPPPLSTPHPSPPPPPPPNLPSFTALSSLFELGIRLSFYDGTGHAETVIYKGVMLDGLGCDFFCWKTNTQIRKRTFRNNFFRMVSFVF
jgi:hypothetical protein